MKLLNKFLFSLLLLFIVVFTTRGQQFFLVSQKVPTAKKSSVFGILNYNGKKIIDLKYNNIHYLQHHFLASPLKNGPCDLIDTTGNVIFSDISNYYFLGNERFVWIKSLDKLNKGKWVFYKTNGKKVSDHQYDNIFFTSYTDHALVLKDSTYMFIDTTGNALFTNINYQSIKMAISNYLPLKNSIPVNKSVTNAENNHSIIIFKDKVTHRFGIKNQGKSNVTPIFTEVKKTGTNLLIVKKGNKYGLIDFSGKTVLNPDYDAIPEVTETIFVLCKSGNYGIMDRSSKILRIPFAYKELMLVK